MAASANQIAVRLRPQFVDRQIARRGRDSAAASGPRTAESFASPSDDDYRTTRELP